MFLPPHYPTRFLTAAQDVIDPGSPDTQATDLPDSATQPLFSDNGGHSSRNSVPLGVLKKRPSLSHVLGRVRPDSGSSTSSDGPKPSTVTRPVKSVKFASNQPKISLAEDPPSTNARHRRDLAPWDRMVDFVYHQYPDGTSGPDKSLDFERSINLFLAEHGRQRTPTPRGYSTLPAAVRLKIWEYIVNTNTNDKPVALTMAYWNKDAWREDEFATLREAMKTTRPCLEVSFEFRADALVAFLMTRRFHVTFSPCIRPLLNPLATKWLEKYGPYMQDITLEVVLTEFRFGMGPSAQFLSPATAHLEKLIRGFVQVQLRRRSVSTLNSLVILCRRFYGTRRAKPHARSTEVSGDEGVYCPNKYLSICDHIKELHGLVDSVRVCGFSQPYTFSLATSLFSIPSPDKLRMHSYQVAPSNVWPQLEGQEAQIDLGDGHIKLQRYTGIRCGSGTGSWGAMQLPAPVGSTAGATWMEKQIWLRQVTIRK